MIGISAASSLQATTYVITSTSDVVADNLECTLREALIAVRDRVASMDCPAGTATNTIELQFGAYDWDSTVFDINDGNTDEPINLTITGLNGVVVATRIDLGSSLNFLEVSGDLQHTIQLSGIQVQNGDLSSNGRGAVSVFGNSNLVLSNMRFVGGGSPAGTAVLFTGLDLSISDSAFDGWGGLDQPAVEVDSTGVVEVMTSTFSNNIDGALQVEIGDPGAGGEAYLTDLDFVDDLSEAFTGVLFTEVEGDAIAELENLSLSGPRGLGVSAPAVDIVGLGSGTVTLSGLEVAGGDHEAACVELLAFDDSRINASDVTVRDSTCGGSAPLSVDGRDSSEILVNGAVVTDNLAIDTFGSRAAGVALEARENSEVIAERLDVRRNGYVASRGATGHQVLVTTFGNGSSGPGTAVLRSSLIADSAANGLIVQLGDDGLAQIFNITVVGNVSAAGGFIDPGAFFFVSNMILFGNANDTPPMGLGGFQNSLLGVDPLFVDPANGDYRLQATSTALDVGQPLWVGTVGDGDFDLDGNPREIGVEIDAGAYEFQGTMGAPIFADGFESGDTEAWN